MKPAVVRLLVCVAFSTSLACASAKLTVLRPLETHPKRISLSFEPASSTQLSPENKSRLRTALTNPILKRGVLVTGAGEPEVWAVQGEITRFDTGNRALRYFIGFGAGTGNLSSTWKVLDSQGQEVGACQLDGSMSAGAFGGHFDEVLEKAGGELAHFITGVK